MLKTTSTMHMPWITGMKSCCCWPDMLHTAPTFRLALASVLVVVFDVLRPLHTLWHKTGSSSGSSEAAAAATAAVKQSATARQTVQASTQPPAGTPACGTAEETQLPSCIQHFYHHAAHAEVHPAALHTTFFFRRGTSRSVTESAGAAHMFQQG
jgi:hypothetical protein